MSTSTVTLKRVAVSLIGLALAGWLQVPARAVSPSDAAATISHCLQIPFPVREWDRDSELHRPAVVVYSQAGMGKVDEATGILVRWFMIHPRGRPPATESNRLTNDHALATAEAFLRRVGLDLPNWTLDQDEYLSGASMYDIGWHRYFAGIQLPSFISVDVDATTGDVISYMLIDDPVVVSLQPRVSAGEAVATAIQRANLVDPLVKSVRLTVWYVPTYPGPQALEWQVRLEPPNQVREQWVDVTIDAQTGALDGLMLPAGGAMIVRGHDKIDRRTHPKRPQDRPPTLSPKHRHPRFTTPGLDLKKAVKEDPPLTMFQQALRARGESHGAPHR